MEITNEANDQNQEQKVNWNEGRKHVLVLEEQWNALDDLKLERNFHSLASVINYLLGIESSVKKHNLIEDQYTCTQCGLLVQQVTPKVASRLHRYRHFQCDHTTDCEGKLRHGYGVIIKKDKQTGTIEHEDAKVPLFDLKMNLE